MKRRSLQFDRYYRRQDKKKKMISKQSFLQKRKTIIFSPSKRAAVKPGSFNSRGGLSRSGTVSLGPKLQGRNTEAFEAKKKTVVIVKEDTLDSIALTESKASVSDGSRTPTSS